jgi:hypothetical protein
MNRRTAARRAAEARDDAYLDKKCAENKYYAAAFLLIAGATIEQLQSKGLIGTDVTSIAQLRDLAFPNKE